MLSQTQEDYLEVIYLITQAKKTVQSKDIALKMAVSLAFVTKILRLLAAKHLIDYTPYMPVLLTEKGILLARRLVGKHNLLKAFFQKALAIDGQQAEEYACHLEHIASEEMLEKCAVFLDRQTKAKI